MAGRARTKSAPREILVKITTVGNFKSDHWFPSFRGNMNPMSAPDISTETMGQFRGSGVEKHSTVLLGAGASITSGLPSWDEFAARLLISADVVSESLATHLLTRQDPMIAVEAARSNIEAADSSIETTWTQQLSDQLYATVSPLESLSPSPLHQAAVGHYLKSPENRSLVTLNFDVLIEAELNYELEEESNLESKPSLTSITNSESRQGEHSVHHLHGLITPDRAEDVVLTLNDFTALLENRNSWQFKYLKSAVYKGALVIAGTSYRDPDLRQWLHAALKSKPDNHKAFVLLARESFGISKDEFEMLESALSSQWKAVGLHPVLMQDHTDAAQIIRELDYVNREEYISPQDRCKIIWGVHVRNFGELQSVYVDELGKNASNLKNLFEVSTLDVTLWLSNGDGKLIRWASQDRVYRSLDALREVEAGHDSPWIAGQALAQESVIISDLSDHPTRRWNSVIAAPISVEHPLLPFVTCAVLTVGIPESANSFEEEAVKWGDELGKIADQWSSRIFERVYPGEEA